jgi:muconolactone delta-isomerase
MSTKRLLKETIFLAAILVLSSLSGPLIRAQAQTPGTNGGAIPPAEVERIIKAFTAKETQFRHALNEYSFKRDAVLQSLGMGGQVTGEYHRVSLFTFDDAGTRYEKISYFPMPSFNQVTQEDLEDLGGIQPFALEPSKIPQYDFKYVGKDKIDELNLYVFDVTPKVIPDPKKSKERFFSGRVWVDDQDLQIVKTKGKGVPETKKNKFPIVETYREQIDGRYWFPTYSYADEELVFDNGDILHIRMKVRYSDFELARAKVKINEVDDPNAPKQETKPPGTKPPETVPRKP